MNEGKSIGLIMAGLPGELEKLGREEIEKGSLEPPIQILCAPERGNPIYELKMDRNPQGVSFVVERQRIPVILSSIPPAFDVTVTSQVDGKKIQRELLTRKLHASEHADSDDKPAQ